MTDLCVIGLGYVGLPTAALFARAGLQVAGADINAAIVSAVNEGRAPLEEPGLDDLLAQVASEGRLRAAEAPVPADAFLIAVGTPVGADHAPNLEYVKRAAAAIAPVLRPGNLVVVESTVPPGTTADVVRQILEDGSGLTFGRDFLLAHCAERAIPGHALREMVENERLVGGLDSASTSRAAALYGRMVTGAIHETDAVTSEIVKLAENTYRDVNIALANEFARLCERVGADVWKVVSYANKHPRVHVHEPGPGVGGHCIPVVPWFLAAVSPDETPLIHTARGINDDQPRLVVDRVASLVERVGAPARIAVLGVAYKPGIDDTRETPALPIIEGLEGRGFDVRVSDPHVKRFARPLVSVDEAVRDADLVLILNAEATYAGLDPAELVQKVRTPIVYDTRRTIDLHAWRRAGFVTARLGSGGRPPTKE